jgi:hypothetical protein
MKKMVVTIVLLCLSSTVLAHDIYSNLRDRDGHLCCGGQDCKPVEAVALPDGNYYLPGTDEVIPADMAAPSPDDRFHHCIYHQVYIGSDPWGYPSDRFAWDPQHWCFRAEEARAVADQMTHEESRTIMRRITMDYDRLAKVAEEQLADQEAIGRKT